MERKHGWLLALLNKLKQPLSSERVQLLLLAIALIWMGWNSPFNVGPLVIVMGIVAAFSRKS